LFWVQYRLIFRQLLKEKLYPLINVLGLALGLCCFTILSTILRHELAYDTHHDNHAEIYRIISKVPFGNSALTPEGLGPILLQDHPQLGEYVRFQETSQDFLQTEEKSAFWDRMYLADDNVFDMFSHEIVYGDTTSAFDAPFSIAISKPMSEFYFGDLNPIGEVLSTGTLDYTVSLVFEPLPGNTHLKYDALVPFKLLLSINPERADTFISNLGWVTAYTYFRLPPEFDISDFDSISDSFYNTYRGDSGGAAENSAELQSLTSIHYGEKLQGDQPTGNIFYLYGYSAVAVLVLVVAIFNYVALSTARSIRRCREIGIRKILGSSKRQLIAQYLGESVSISILAALAGLILAELVLRVNPLSNSLAIGDLVETYFTLEYLVLFLVFGIIVGIISGAYPSFYLVRMPLMNSLNGEARNSGRNFNLGKLLLFAQITTSVVIIGSSFAIQSHIQFLLEKPLGFERNNRIVLEIQGADAIENIPVIREELIASGYVSNVAFIYLPPGTDPGSGSNFPVENENGVMTPTSFDRVFVGENYIPTMDIVVSQGVDFTSDNVSNIFDTVMVNETMVRLMEWSNPIGKEIEMMDTGRISRVIGVTRDFNYGSLHNAVGPMVLQPMNATDFTNTREAARPRFRRNIVINLSDTNSAESLRTIERTIQRFDPDYVFEPQFLESNLNQLYSPEIRLKNLIATFSFIALFISVMGVFGQTAIASEKRKKEIAIRKVLGANWVHVTSTLSREFLPLFIISAIVASVTGVYFLTLWVRNFAYHESVTILPFLGSALLVVLIASATIAFQSISASHRNPVDVLQDD